MIPEVRGVVEAPEGPERRGAGREGGGLEGRSGNRPPFKNLKDKGSGFRGGWN
jgi:hypothetical protein